MSKEKLRAAALRLPLLIAGLFFLAFGVALSTKSGLGVSPSASLTYLLSQIFPAVSMGTFTTLLNVLYTLIQIAVLGKKWRPWRLLQLAVVFVFGYFTDFTLALVAPLSVEKYILRLALCVLSCAIMGFGVFLEVKANVIVMASEGAISAIAAAVKRDFGQIKIINDCICVLLSVVISLLVLGKVSSVREGTIIAAVLVGLCTQFFNRHIHIFDPQKAAPEAEQETDWAKDYPLVITIEREFGSGGTEIGKALAEKLGIKFYDYDLIQKVAEETGLPFERVERKEERIRGLFYTLYNQANAYSNDLSSQDAIFEAQRKIIEELSKDSCVIMGRLGAYILKTRPNTLHMFISAKEEFRAARIARQYRLSPEQALETVRREDELRHSYAQHFTGQPWGQAQHYRLCLDSSAYGIEQSLRIIREALKDFRAMYIGG
ncbi:MAG: cytidylate kinase family protein [Oscillospiraceae bacterium]|nr:cytidylate kinase family protein [Oscillospiraceae bacterium]